jgi:hypothetical protein
MKDLIGKKVVLKPKEGRDAFDMFFLDTIATVESVEVDFENRTYLGVVLDIDEGKDLGLEHKIGHRFFFDIDELELLAADLRGKRG